MRQYKCLCHFVRFIVLQNDTFFRIDLCILHNVYLKIRKMVLVVI